MTSFIPNTLSATLKESNYQNQIYSCENYDKFPNSQSYDDNDERYDPKYGDLFYEDYKKKNDEKDKSEKNSTGENSIEYTPIPKETKNENPNSIEILGNKRNRSKSKKNENLSKEKGANENFENKSNNDIILIESSVSKDNPIGADETSKETPHQTICDISQKEKEDMKKKGRKTPDDKIEELTGIIKNKKEKTNKGKNGESGNDSENTDSSKKDSVDKQKLPESFEQNPLNSKSQKQISQDLETNKDISKIKLNLDVKKNFRKDNLSPTFEKWKSKINNFSDMKNYLENDEIKENIKKYLKGILEAFGNEDFKLVYPGSTEEKIKISPFLDFLIDYIKKQKSWYQNKKCRFILEILYEKNSLEELNKLTEFIKLEKKSDDDVGFIRIKDLNGFQEYIKKSYGDIYDIRLTKEEKDDIMNSIDILIEIALGIRKKRGKKDS
jgi:hypothetical protein